MRNHTQEMFRRQGGQQAWPRFQMRWGGVRRRGKEARMTACPRPGLREVKVADPRVATQWRQNSSPGLQASSPTRGTIMPLPRHAPPPSC